MGPTVLDGAMAWGERVQAGGTGFVFGNGGSAAQASHFSTELVGRFERERAGIRSYALVSDPSLITAIANDYSFDVAFARQTESLCWAGHVVVALSTSGNSDTVLRGVEAAAAIGALTVGDSGADGGARARSLTVALAV